MKNVKWMTYMVGRERYDSVPKKRRDVATTTASLAKVSASASDMIKAWRAGELPKTLSDEDYNSFVAASQTTGVKGSNLILFISEPDHSGFVDLLYTYLIDTDTFEKSEVSRDVLREG